MLPTKKLSFKAKNAAPDSTSIDEESSTPNKSFFKPTIKSFKKAPLKPMIKPSLGFESDFNHKKTEDPELIASFSENKAVNLNEKPVEGPLVIPFTGNSQGWRLKRSVNYVPKTGPDNKDEIITKDRVEVADPSTYGLQISKKVKTEVSEDLEQTPISPIVPTATNEPISLEKEAELALISAAQGQTYSSKKIDAIPLSTSAPRSEAEAFKEDLSSRPDECTLEDYERVPVEQFGAALLRGMGWKDGEAIGPKKKTGTYNAIEFRPRERLLGLGAKPNPLEKNKKKPPFRRQ